MVAGTFIFCIAVLVNSVVCIRIREENPSGNVPGHPGYRNFVALPEDIPDVHTKIGFGPLIPVLGPLRVIAKDDYIVGWWHNGNFGPIFDYDGNRIMKSIRSGTTYIIRYQNTDNDPAQVFLRIEQYIRDRSRSPVRGRSN